MQTSTNSKHSCSRTWTFACLDVQTDEPMKLYFYYRCDGSRFMWSHVIGPNNYVFWLFLLHWCDDEYTTTLHGAWRALVCVLWLVERHSIPCGDCHMLISFHHVHKQYLWQHFVDLRSAFICCATHRFLIWFFRRFSQRILLSNSYETLKYRIFALMMDFLVSKQWFTPKWTALI